MSNGKLNAEASGDCGDGYLPNDLRFCREAWRGRRPPQVYLTRRPSVPGLVGSKRVLDGPGPIAPFGQHATRPPFANVLLNKAPMR